MPLGAQVSCNGGLPSAIARAVAMEAECFQIHLSAPRQWRGPRHSDEDVASFTTAVSAARLGPNMAHAPYLINLASPDVVLRARSVEALRACRYWADRCGLAGCVVHVGSGVDASVEQAEIWVAEALAEVLSDDTPGLLLLENSAGSGHTLGARFEQIGRLLRDLAGDQRLGMCLDTAHAFASGYDLRIAIGLDDALSEIDAAMGLHRLRLIHVNDSRVGLGRAVDRHANIGEGEIGEEAFGRMLEHAALKDLPWMLEVPGRDRQGPDADSIRLLKRLRGDPDPATTQPSPRGKRARATHGPRARPPLPPRAAREAQPGGAGRSARSG